MRRCIVNLGLNMQFDHGSIMVQRRKGRESLQQIPIRDPRAFLDRSPPTGAHWPVLTGRKRVSPFGEPGALLVALPGSSTRAFCGWIETAARPFSPHSTSRDGRLTTPYAGRRLVVRFGQREWVVRCRRQSVIPAQAGIHPPARRPWTPAFAGVTRRGRFRLREADH